MNNSQIIKMYKEEKMSTYEIAKAMNTYPNKIRRILIKNSVEIKDKSEAQKNAIKKGLAKIPTKGKVRSKEEKLKISKSLKKYWNEMGDEDYKKRVKLAKQKWDEMNESTKKEMQSLAIKAIQKAGKEGSKLERFLAKEIEEAGFIVKTHLKNLIPNENLEIDIYCPELKCVVEIDGPSHFLPIWGDEKLMKQIKSDSNKTGLILSKGFAIIRVKHLNDSPSLIEKENIKNYLIEQLTLIRSKFPVKSKRYIEVEI